MRIESSRGRSNSTPVAGIFAVLLLLHSIPAMAGEAGPAEPYRLEWRRDLPLMALAGIALAAPELFNDGRRPCPCTKEGINRFDRGVAGRSSEAADRASDVVAGLLLTAPFALDAVDAHWSRRTGIGSDAIVILEAMVADQGLGRLTKAAVRRPRPFLYGLSAGDPAFREADSYRSFYSTHVSTSFAAGLSYARTFALRHPRSSYRWAVYGAAILGGGTVGVLRVAAGKHFPTDVITGAAAGSAVGLLVPALHRRGASTAYSITPYHGGGVLSVSLALR